MDHISKHLHNAGQSTTTTQAGQQQPTAEQQEATALLINNLFKELTAIFPAWKQAFSSTTTLGEVKNQWMKGLMEAGISDWEAIQGGLATCRASGKAFMPSVGEFTGSCKQAVYERLGALETMKAYKHLLGYYATPVEHREPCRLNPFVYHLISQDSFDSFAFKGMKTEDAVKHFSASYKVVLDYVSNGGELRKPVQKSMRIDNPSGTTHQRKTSKEAAHSRIKALQESLRN